MPPRASRRVLVLDIGGTHVKVFLPGHRTPLKIPSGPSMGPRQMMAALRPMLRGIRFNAVSVGYPGYVERDRIVREPHNLGVGWVGYDLARELGAPVRIVNDAALQALGSYRDGVTLFLGFGTGLGTAMVVDGQLVPMELAHLPFKKGRTFEEYVGEAALHRLGRRRWRREVSAVVAILSAALWPEHLVLGGGNLRKLARLPPHARRVPELAALIGGERLWQPTSKLRPRRRPSRLNRGD